MTLKYESEIIKEIVDTRGHESSLTHYESECVESWIEEVKGGYPKLCDYQAEWLNYINENTGIGDFPYHTLVDVTDAVVENVVPYAYKSAILKGQTLVNLVKDENRVYTLIADGTYKLFHINLNTSLEANKKYYLSYRVVMNTILKGNFGLFATDGDSHCGLHAQAKRNETGTMTYVGYVNKVADKLRIFIESNCVSGTFEVTDIMLLEYQEGMENWDIPYFEGMASVKAPVLTTSNEDGTKTNILTVNEDVTLRSNGSVQDELNLLTGELTTKNGEMVIDGREEFNWGKGWSSYGTVYPLGNPSILDNYNFKKGKNLICEQIQTLNSFNYADKVGIAPDVNSRGIILVVPNELTGGPNNVNGLRAWLNENPLTIVYELNQPSIKTVDLTIIDQDGNTLSKIKPIEGTMVISTDGTPIKPLLSAEIPVEATTQNLSSFIELEME